MVTKKHTVGGRTAAERRAAVVGAQPVTGLTAHIRTLQQLTGWRAWLVNGATAVLVPICLLLLLDGVLQLVGYGYRTEFCLKRPVQGVYVENDDFLYQFYSRKADLHPNPFAVPIEKPRDGLRVVILGESAAAGTPDPAYNFGRVLERMLREEFPKVEVINAAMRGVNSHILLPVARDCEVLKPDVYIVYVGNNEAVGLYAPGPRSGRLTGYLKILRTIQWVRTTNIGQLLEPLLMGLDREGAAAKSQDEGFFLEHRVAADDPRREAVYRNFKVNLADICRSARAAGAEAVLVTVGVNLRDCPPFGSLHRPNLPADDLRKWEAAFNAGVEAEAKADFSNAIRHYQEAAATDDHFAELHFRLARCCEQMGDTAKARQEFLLARDWDALQFRTDSRLTALTKEVAAEQSARLVDAEAALGAVSGELKLPGGALFYDHAHPNFDGDYVLAKSLFPTVRELLAKKRGSAKPGEGRVLSREECAARLAFTRVNEGQAATEMVKALNLPPFTCQFDHAVRQKLTEQRVFGLFKEIRPDALKQATSVYQGAMRQYPDDWRLPYNLGRLLLLVRDFPGAAQQLERAQRAMPHWPPLRLALSGALQGAGRNQEAREVLEEGLKQDPHSEVLKKAIALLHGNAR